MVKRGKKGQFYLVAGIIISVLAIGIIAVSNFSRGQETTNLQEIGKEISIESEKVLDYALYNGRETGQAAQDFAEDYINNVNKEESYFIFGNDLLITVTGYSETGKTVSINEQQMQLNAGEVKSEDFASLGSDVTLMVDGKYYEFELKQGKNFYFVIFDEEGGENHVITNA
ncbi:MAG: hypothetical protein WD876_02525 [Candidatus Pacearchaeota archaeon]